jgi:hypothetical protein
MGEFQKGRNEIEEELRAATDIEREKEREKER